MTENTDENHRPHGGCFADSSRDVVLSPGRCLSIQDFVAVARGDGTGRYARVVLDGDWRGRCKRSADYVRQAVQDTMGKSSDELRALVEFKLRAAGHNHTEPTPTRALIYGVTTGFGSFKNRPLDSIESAAQMQRNILRSHATGCGPPFATEVVRGMMLLRVRTFIEGHSGVRPEIVEFLVELLNRRVHPWVPEQGSVGSSGDLCPLAHLGLTVIGEGLGWLAEEPHGARYEWIEHASVEPPRWDTRADRRPVPRPMREVLGEADLADRVFTALAPKEGLALTNGTAASTAIAALAVYDASVLYGTANLAAAVSLEALLGFTRAFDPKVHRVRNHSGQSAAAAQILSFVTGSDLVNRAADVQDAYSVRCAPAVHGAALQAVSHAWNTIERELNAVTDNPLFLLSDAEPPCDEYAACVWDAYAAGNFHGEPIGMVCDYLKIAVAELGSISERRTQSLLDPNHNRGLPANLWPEANTAGLNSGLMVAQYAAASLVSENKILAHPASVDSIPTASNVEDHVAMSTIAARNARKVIGNACAVLAIEILANVQALDIRLKQENRQAPRRPGAGTEAVVRLIRRGTDRVPRVSGFHAEDGLLWPDLASITGSISSGDLLRVALRASRMT